MGSKLLELLTCLIRTNPVRRKRPIMSWLLGYSVGLFFFLELLGWWFQTFFMFIPKIGEMIQFDERIFQMGWFNHQLYRKELSQIFLHGSKMKDDSQLEDSQILSKLPFFPRCHEYVTYSCKCFAQGFQDVKSVPKGMGFLKHPTRWWFQIFI